MITHIQSSKWLSLVVAAALVGTAALAFTMFSADAHQDPGTCFSNGVGLSVAVYRADGTTPVAAGTVESGETIKYEATLSHLGGSNCNFEGGTLTITTPDTVGHIVASGAGIPLVTSGSPFVAPQQSYIVSEGDVDGGFLNADVTYAGGTSHTPTQHQNASAGVDISTPYEDVSLEVTKTVTPALDRTITWEIDKSVDVDEHTLLDGEEGTSNYDVLVTKTSEDTNYSAAGNISVHNPALFAAANVTDVTDSVDGNPATVDCTADENWTGSFPVSLPAGATLNCTYAVSGLAGDEELNTAEATTDGDVDGDTGEAAVDWNSAVINEVGFDEINVTDTVEGALGSTSETHTFEYERAFTCGEDEGNHPNTATITETGQSDYALVVVNCVEGLIVEKTANTSYDRDWDWTIEKSADQTDLNMDEGQTATVNYEVTVTPSSEDINHEVTGTITITNPVGNPSATITGVSDELDASGAATVDCGVTFPHLLAAGAQLNCTYEKLGALTTDTENTATVTTDGAVPGGEDTVAVTWGAPASETDECVTVNDDNENGPQGVEICADHADKTIEYSVSFGTAETDSDVTVACGENEHPNIADFVTSDQNEEEDDTGSDNWTVTITVECGGEWCSPGYWRNHLDEAEVAAAAGGFELTDKYSDFDGAPTIKVAKGKKAGDANADPTLLDVLQNPQLYGGDAFNFVGDLLSEAHPDVDFEVGDERVEDSCLLN